MFVIKHIDTGKYVARPGAQRSYTNDLEAARIFRTREEAKKELCEENEVIIDLDRLITILRPTQ